MGLWSYGPSFWVHRKPPQKISLTFGCGGQGSYKQMYTICSMRFGNGSGLWAWKKWMVKSCSMLLLELTWTDQHAWVLCIPFLSHQDLKLRRFLAAWCRFQFSRSGSRKLRRPPLGSQFWGDTQAYVGPKKNGRLMLAGIKQCPPKVPTTRGTRGTLRWSDVIKGNPRNGLKQQIKTDKTQIKTNKTQIKPDKQTDKQQISNR